MMIPCTYVYQADSKQIIYLRDNGILLVFLSGQTLLSPHRHLSSRLWPIEGICEDSGHNGFSNDLSA